MYKIRIIFAAHSNKITNKKMKKITFALAACAALTFAACGNNATEENKIDSPAVETTTVEETVEIDTTPVDTAKPTTVTPTQK